MTTSTTPISLAGTSSPVSVAQELGLGLTTTISMNDAGVRTLAGVGGSGTSYGMNSLQAKTNRVSINISLSSPTQNYLLNTAKAGGYIAGKSDIVLTITSDVGSSSPGSFALDVDTSWNVSDTITIVNNGAIIGCGGQGTGGVDASNNPLAPTTAIAGGTALRAQRAISITNNGTVAGGGGAGGTGGAGSAAKNGTPGAGGAGGGGAGYSGGIGGGANNSPLTIPSAAGANGTRSAGGAGSAGGVGAGDATSGGAGGVGGGWGSAGATGATAGYAGSAGSAGGSCTSGNANITWNAVGLRYGALN